MEFVAGMLAAFVMIAAACANMIKLLKVYFHENSTWEEIKNEAYEVIPGNTFLCVVGGIISASQMWAQGIFHQYIWILVLFSIPLVSPWTLFIASRIALKSNHPSPLYIRKTRDNKNCEDVVEKTLDAIQMLRDIQEGLDAIREKHQNHSTTDNMVRVQDTMNELKPIMGKTPAAGLYAAICKEAKAIPEQSWDKHLSARMQEYYLPALGKLAKCYVEAPEKIRTELEPELDKMVGLLRDIVSEATSDAYEQKVAAIKAEVTSTQNLAKLRGDVAEQDFELPTILVQD